MADRLPCVLAYGGNWPDGSVYRCARCMAVRRFWRGRSIVASVFCDATVGQIPLPADDLESWRRLGRNENAPAGEGSGR